MLAYGADLGSLCSHYKMTAITAFPNLNAALFKHGLGLHIIQQGAITLLMGLLDGDNTATVFLKFEDLVKYVKSCGHTITYIKV